MSGGLETQATKSLLEEVSRLRKAYARAILASGSSLLTSISRRDIKAKPCLVTFPLKIRHVSGLFS